jgi:hypothetical protein
MGTDLSVPVTVVLINPTVEPSLPENANKKILFENDNIMAHRRALAIASVCDAGMCVIVDMEHFRPVSWAWMCNHVSNFSMQHPTVNALALCSDGLPLLFNGTDISGVGNSKVIPVAYMIRRQFIATFSKCLQNKYPVRSSHRWLCTHIMQEERDRARNVPDSTDTLAMVLVGRDIRTE